MCCVTLLIIVIAAGGDVRQINITAGNATGGVATGGGATGGGATDGRPYALHIIWWREVKTCTIIIISPRSGW